jgi:hypothetical protein
MRSPKLLTYGEEWRARARAGERLGSDERKAWEDDLEWDEENAEQAEHLESLVGRKVIAARDLVCVDGQVVHRDTAFFVRARARDRLIVWRPEWGALLMREDWLVVMPTLPPSEEPEDDEDEEEQKEEEEDEPEEPREDLTPLVADAPRWARRAVAFLGSGSDEIPLGDD